MPSHIPIGALEVHDDHVPALEAGSWLIGATHTVDVPGLTSETFRAAQELVVEAPQFTIDPNEVLAVYPPAGSRGVFGEVLAHVVLAEPMLPWERRLGGETPKQPWLALLVLSDDEIVGGEGNPTRAQHATVAELLGLGAGTLAPKVTRDQDVAPEAPCSYVELRADAFAAITPRLGELRFLAHCREANTDDRSDSAIDERGLVSLVVANRFPERGPKEAPTGTRSIAHLVSVEGFEDYLVDAPQFGSHTSVALVSLYSWTFETLHDPDADFAGLAANLVASGMTGTTHDPAKLWLRLAPPAAGDDAGSKEAARRIADGFVPLAYATRSGERTLGWYRGPLTPLVTTPPATTGPWLRADAALAYQPEFGVFDLSLAAAWQAGRAAALADGAFAQRLLDLRRRLHGVVDRQLDRLRSAHFSARELASADRGAGAHHELLGLLDAQLVADAAKAIAPSESVVEDRVRAPAGSARALAHEAVRAFVAEPETQALMREAVSQDLDPVASWLAGLLLFERLPFHYLVADDDMLPPESVRFFHVDRAWQAAMLDGACSIGTESSRTLVTTHILRGLVQHAADERARVRRARRRGVDAGPPQAGDGPMSGLLLRSALASGWPNLAVRARKADASLLAVRRMEHLSPSVLLCLFDGVPASVELSEPPEGLRFGVDGEGRTVLRELVNAKQLGRALDARVDVYDLTGTQQRLTRAAGSRVLHVGTGAGDGGLVDAFDAALKATSGDGVGAIGPADLSLQMVKAPESVTFAFTATKEARDR